MLQRKEEPGFLYMFILNRSLTLRLGKEKSIKRFAVFGDSQNDFYSPLAFKGGKLFKEPIAPNFRHRKFSTPDSVWLGFHVPFRTGSCCKFCC